MIASRDDLIADAFAIMEALSAYKRRSLSAQPMQREISLPQLNILMMLQDRGSMTLSELSHWLGVSAPSAHSILDRMEENRLVERIRDTVDRRVVHVRATDSGRSAVENLVGLHRERARHLFATMTDEELADTVKGLEAVQRALDRLHSSSCEL